MDSLGLGLTLDTTLLEKADKTLENMQRNSQLIMQNLNKGFSAFNRGDTSDFSKPFEAIKKAMDTIKNSKVSIEFESEGQDRFLEGLNQIMEQVERIRQIGEIGGDKVRFFDPSEVRVTTESLTELKTKAEEIGEAFKKVQEELSLGVEFGKDISGNNSKIAKLKDDLSEIGKAAELTTKEFTQMENELKNVADISEKEYKDIKKIYEERFNAIKNEELSKNSDIGEEELANIVTQKEEIKSLIDSVIEKQTAWNEAKKSLEEYSKKFKELRELEAKKEAHDNLQLNRDKEKAYQEMLADNMAEQKFAGATIAQQNAMLVSQEQKRLADTNKEVANLTKLYKEATSNLEKYKGELSELLTNIGTVGKKRTSAQDEEVTRLLQEIDQARSILNQLRTEAPEVIEKIEAVKTGEDVQKKAEEEAAKVKASLDYAKVFSDNAKSIDEEIEAISMLKRARNALASDTTADYNKEIAEANKRISKHEDHIKLLTQEQKESKTLEDSVISRYLRERKEADKLGDELRELNRTRKERSTDYTPEEKENINAMISRWRTLRKDISEIEENNEAHLSQLQEKYASQRAEEEIKRMLSTNEREKQEYAKLLDDKYALEKQKKAMKDAGAGVGDKAYDNILKQEQDLNNRISQLRAKHKKDLEEFDKKHNKKRNDDDVKAFIEAQKEKERIAEQTAKKIREEARKYGTISSASAERLIGVTDNAKNINQHKAAIQKLEQARASLDNTDKNYYVTLKKIEKALQRHHKELRLAGVESNNLMQSHRGLLNIGGQLARRLALVFSVSQLTQYFRKLVEVRGQFEKTEVALTSIIGDNQKAQKLMNQTIALAIKSPFTLQQLTSYTKQLAAYQVSYEELHSTTKMLADVSAGLGVEMDRLILAFGQVKAANYLRATEVRQFTEAGFNILGELAKYYSKLEGTMVSVGDVQERVTKRMVDFADVEEIFHRVTEAGGMFYEMQSKQAETLAGQWTNLQDRIDVMFNEIGKSGDVMLKGIVRTLASLIDNWEAVADVLKIVVIAFALYKANLLAVTKAQIANNLATQESIMLKIKEAWAAKSLSPIYKSLASSMKGFGSSMKVFGKANLWVAALTAVISSIVAITRHIKKVNEALAEQDKIFNENTSSLQKLSEKYKEASKYSGDFNKKMEALRELSGKLEDRNLKLSVEIDEVKEDNIDKIFEENEQRLQKAYDFGKDLGKAIANGMNEAQGTILGFSFFGENLKEDAEDYGQSMGKLMSWGMQVQMESIEDAARVNYKNMGKYAREYFDSIKDGQRKNESDYEWAKRRATALVMISKLESDIVGKNKELQRTLRSVVSDSIELHHETKGVYSNLVEAVGGVDNLRRKLSDKPIDIAAQIKTEVDKLEYDPATKQFIMNDLYAMLHLKVNYVEDPNAQPSYQWEGFKNDLKESREDLKKFLDENNKSLGYENFFFSEDEIKKLEQFSDALEAIQKKYDENKKALEQLDGTSDEYSKEEKERLKALQDELKEVAKKWNYDLEKDKSGKGKDERLELLKNQISLIKEMNKEYEKLNKTFSKAESLAKVQKAYADTAKELGLDASTMDFTDEGTVKSLEALLGKPEYAANKYVIELQKALDNFKVELGIEVKQEKDQDLKAQVQKIFDQYDLSVELKKLNIPSDLAKSLFDVDYLDLDGLKKAVQDKEAKFIGTDMEDEYKKFLEKIDDLEEKQQLERLKKYVEYAKKGLSERAKIKLEELKKLQEIEETFKVKEGDPADVKAQKEDMSKRASEKVRKESQDAMNKLEWEEFEKSDTFINIFDDIDNASTTLLNHMIGRLEEFKEQWKDMPLEDVNKIIEKLNLLQEKLAKAKPSEAAKKARDEIKAARGQIEMEGIEKIEFEDKDAKELAKKRGKGGFFAAMDEEQAYQDQQKEAAQEQISLLETALRIKEGTATASDKVLQEESKIKDMLNLSKDELEDQLKAQQGIVSNADKQNGKIQKARQSQKNLTAAQEAQYDAIKDSVDMANDLYSAFKELIEVLDADNPAMVFADMGMNILSSIPTMLALISQIRAATFAAEGLGAAMNMAMGIVGLIVMAIQLLVQAISAAVNYAEKMRQMKLDVLAGQVDNLKKKYDALAESIEKAWSYKQLEEYSKELDKVQKKMISAQKQYVQLLRSGKGAEKIIATAEQAQKKLDAGLSVDDLSNKERKALLSEEYQDYKDATEALAEMEKDYVDQKKELLDELGGVTDPKEAAEEFVDAWLDAYKETGDGLSGLDEKFDEFFENLIKKKAAMLVAEKALTGWIDAVNKALDINGPGGADITDEEQKVINKAAEDAKEKANKLLLGIFEGMDFSEADGLSGLQKGIQGITEQQAEILTAYWNSVRGYTASIDSKMDLILANMGVGSENNPMLDQLIAQTSVLNNIYSFLKSMTTSAPRESQFSGLVWKSSM